MDFPTMSEAERKKTLPFCDTEEDILNACLEYEKAALKREKEAEDLSRFLVRQIVDDLFVKCQGFIPTVAIECAETLSLQCSSEDLQRYLLRALSELARNTNYDSYVFHKQVSWNLSH